MNDPSPPLGLLAWPVTAVDPPVLRPTTALVRDDVSNLAHFAKRLRLTSSWLELILCSMHGCDAAAQKKGDCGERPGYSDVNEPESHLNGLPHNLGAGGNCLVRDLPHTRLLLHLVGAPAGAFDPRCILRIEDIRIPTLSDAVEWDPYTDEQSVHYSPLEPLAAALRKAEPQIQFAALPRSALPPVVPGPIPSSRCSGPSERTHSHRRTCSRCTHWRMLAWPCSSL